METNTAEDITQVFTQFKSYYVVWKPRMEKKILRKASGFKSYYVVWKLAGLCFTKDLFACLNRTM